MRKRNRLVEGVGISDADYSPGKTKCLYYAAWQAMLKRCYNKISLIKFPAYIGCSVVPEWHRFTTFKQWMETQDWVGKVLDKDILFPGNKVYGPNKCLFVTQTINTLLNTQPNQRGDLPLGVTRHGNKFKVNFKKHKKTCHIGVYNTAEEAATAYGNAKAMWISEHAFGQTCPRTKAALFKAAANYRKTAP